MIDPAERQLILSQIGRIAEQDLATLWAKASALSSDEFRAYMLEAFPEFVTPFAAAAADAATVWYDETPSTTDYIPEPGPLPLAEQLTTSAAWALGATGAEAIPRLEGTLSRAIFDAARDTVLFNIESEPGATWARHASSNACAFCAMAATRGAVYTSRAAAEGVVGARGVQALGKKYHDKCHCIAVEVRPGQTYKPPPYVEQWNEAYIKATRETPGRGEHGAIDTAAVLAHMRQSLGTH